MKVVQSQFCLSIRKVIMLMNVFNPLKTRNAKTGALAKSEDPDEMWHYAAFQLGLHYLLRQKGSSEKEIPCFLSGYALPAETKGIFRERNTLFFYLGMHCLLRQKGSSEKEIPCFFFHLGLHCLLRQNRSSEKEIPFFF